ncbi:MAG: hypothetical protein LUD82_10005 [Clostridiales bacterium]|nr:hypothetical protein [Clostridiales bacterium]
MFFRCLKTELWKAFHNKRFLLACGIGFVIQCFNLIYNIRYVQQTISNSAEGADIRSGISLFLRWISADGWSLGYYLLLILFPLIVVIPFGWSALSERSSEYQVQMLCREKKVSYFTGKYIAVFLSGGSVIAMTLLVNLLLNALVLPAVVPDISLMNTSILAGELFSLVYYTHPWLYCLLWVGIDFLWGGVLAVTCMLTAQLFKRNIYVLILPFVLYLILDYIGPVSPMQYLLIGGSATRTGATLSAMLIILGLFSYVAGLFLFQRREVL